MRFDTFEQIPEKYKGKVALLDAIYNEETGAYIEGVGTSYNSVDKGYRFYGLDMRL